MDNDWFVPCSASQRMERSLTFDGVNCHLSRRFSHLGICFVFLSRCVTDCLSCLHVEKFLLAPIPVITKKLSERKPSLRDLFSRGVLADWRKETRCQDAGSWLILCVQKQRNVWLSVRALVSLYEVHDILIVLNHYTAALCLLQFSFSSPSINQPGVIKC